MDAVAAVLIVPGVEPGILRLRVLMRTRVRLVRRRHILCQRQRHAAKHHDRTEQPGCQSANRLLQPHPLILPFFDALPRISFGVYQNDCISAVYICQSPCEPFLCIFPFFAVICLFCHRPPVKTDQARCISTGPEPGTRSFPPCVSRRGSSPRACCPREPPRRGRRPSPSAAGRPRRCRSTRRGSTPAPSPG